MRSHTLASLIYHPHLVNTKLMTALDKLHSSSTPFAVQLLSEGTRGQSRDRKEPSMAIEVLAVLIVLLVLANDNTFVSLGVPRPCYCN